MRKELVELDGTIQYIRKAKIKEVKEAKKGGNMILLKFVHVIDKQIEHVWVYDKEIDCEFDFVNNINKKISFNAKVVTYYKYRYNEKIIDYCFTNINNIKIK